MKKYITLLLFTLSSLCVFNEQASAQCAGNCGGSAFFCECDDICWFFLDCCPDICTSCPGMGPETIANCGVFNPPTGTCNTDVSICTPGVAGPFNFEYMLGPPDDYAYPEGCNTGVNPLNNQYAFITLYITQSGPLNLLLQGNTGQGFLDVVVYKIPSGVAPCNAVLNSNNEIGCNYASDDVGCVQFGSQFPCISNVPAPNVQAGDVLMIIVNDYSVQGSDNFTLQLAPTGAQTGPPSSTINPPATTQFCLTDPAIQLTAVNNGGVWSGTGVSATGSFNPATAGVGTHTISYVIGQPPCQSPVSSIALTVTDCNAPCTANSLTVTPSACASAGNTYSVGATFSFTGAPTTGQLIIQDCSGAQVALNPPFVSPITTSLAGLSANGNTNCSLTAHFTANTACTITTAYAAPAGCDCSAFPPMAATVDVDSASCFGVNNGSIDLTVTGGNPSYSYAWQPGGATTQDLDNLAPGTYTVTVTDQNNCTYSTSATVFAPADLGLNYLDQFVCSGDSLAINPNPVPGVTYTWLPAGYFFGSGPIFCGTHNGPGVDTVTVQVTGQSPAACGQQSFRIFVLPQPPVTLLLPGNDTTALCPGDSLVLVNSANAVGYPPVTQYLWNNGSTGPSITVTLPGQYWLQANNAIGCESVDSVYVQSLPLPQISVDSSFYICGTETVALFGYGYDSTVTLLWSTGAVTDSIWVNTPGTYTLTANNGCGSDTATTVVIQIPIVEAGTLPNIFTPNSDGVNDVYDLNDLFYYATDFHVQVFNRWGSKVYDTHDPQINWTAKNLSDGVYYMAILYTDCNHQERKLAHSVTVIGSK